MRVLHVLGELKPSGGEVMLRDAVIAFRDYGVEPIVLSTGDRIGIFADEYRRLDVETLHLPFSKSAGFAKRFGALIRGFEVDVVHIHTERANAALGLIARLTGTRVVRTVHSVFAYTGRLRMVRTLERAILRAVGVQHIAIGPSVETNERRRLHNPTRRVDNWIGPRFRPPSPTERGDARNQYHLSADVVAITTIGNCSSVKNHGALLEALPAITTGLGRPIVYLHAGSGVDEAAERALAESIAHPDIETRFLGSVSDVRPLLWASDVYCMPSLYEGVPIAALEALACGVRSVLADVPGLRDVHEPAETVRFVAPTAPEVARGVRDALHEGPDVDESMLHVARQVRSARRMEAQLDALVGIYRGG